MPILSIELTPAERASSPAGDGADPVAGGGVAGAGAGSGVAGQSHAFDSAA
jgi:hypothetical protein